MRGQTHGNSIEPCRAMRKRIARNGRPTNDLVLSAFVEGNDRAFPHILGLYVKDGSIVASVTYGKGVFWGYISQGQYDLRPSDSLDGTDCRNLPYRDGEMDCVVIDPP